jgi:hypothetical protein
VLVSVPNEVTALSVIVVPETVRDLALSSDRLEAFLNEYTSMNFVGSAAESVFARDILVSKAVGLSTVTGVPAEITPPDIDKTTIFMVNGEADSAYASRADVSDSLFMLIVSVKTPTDSIVNTALFVTL